MTTSWLVPVSMGSVVVVVLSTHWLDEFETVNLLINLDKLRGKTKYKFVSRL